jgi:hypothetical protein
MMTQDELTEAEQLARCYGPANCWTGTSGTLAAWIIRLLNERKELKQQLEAIKAQCEIASNLNRRMEQ